MKTRIFIFALLLLCSIGMSAASISYSVAENKISVFEGATTTTLTEINAGIANKTAINIVGEDAYINATIQIYESGTISINSTDCSNVKFANPTSSLGIFSSRAIIDGVTIGTWDHTLGRWLHPDESLENLQLNPSVLQNVTFNGISYVYVNGDVDNTTFRDLTFINGSSATSHHVFDTVNFDDVVLDNITIINCRGGVSIGGGTNVTVSNSSYEGNNYHLSPDSGFYGFVAQDDSTSDISRNVTFSDIYVNSTHWSGVDEGDNSENCSFVNLTIRNAGHVGLDIHGGPNQYVSNVSVYNSITDNYLFNSANGTRVYDIYSYEPGGDHLVTDVYPNNTRLYMENIAMESSSSSRGIVTLDQQDSIFRNVTYTDTNKIVFVSVANESNPHPPNNLTFINLNSPNAPFTIEYAEMVNLINCNQTSIVRTGGNYSVYWYLNAQVVNTTSHTVIDAELTANTTTRNGYGLLQSTFYTDVNGQLYDSGNYSNSMAILDLINIDGSTTQYDTLVTASKLGETDTEVINPDSTYYSGNLSNYSGALVTFILDVEGTGNESPIIPLSITTSSPSGATISIDNETALTTSITVNKESIITTYLDTVLVQTNTSVTTATYVNDSMTEGEHNVTMIASVGGESVNRVWTVTVTEVSIPIVDADDENQSAELWKTNIGMISIAMLILIIAVPIAVIRSRREVSAENMDTMIFAVVVIFVVAIVAIFGTGVLQEISYLMP